MNKLTCCVAVAVAGVGRLSGSLTYWSGARKPLLTILLFLLLGAVGNVAVGLPDAHLFVADNNGRLWTVDVVTGEPTLIGNMGIDFLLDIAMSPTGQLFGTSQTDLYEIDPANAQLTLVGLHFIIQPNALDFDQNGVLYAANVSRELWLIDTTSAASTFIGNTGFASSGDLAFGPDGTLFMSARSGGGNPDLLVELDAKTAAGTLIGDIGFVSVFGMDFMADILLGTTSGGQLIQIDPRTASAVSIASTGIRAFGAAAAVMEGGNLDIKPGSCPNSFNRNSNGVLPVALVGDPAFNVGQVDLTTVRLERADGIGGFVQPNEGPPGPHSAFEDVATPFPGLECDCHELSGDGITDLSMKFLSSAVTEVLLLNDLDPGDLVELVLSGDLVDGTPFSASDCVRLVPLGDMDGDGSVNVADLLALLAAWGTEPGGPPDFDGSGNVAVPDLLILLANWG